MNDSNNSKKRLVLPTSSLALLLVVGGAALIFIDLRLQLVSMACVFVGLLISCIALIIHRRQRAALADALLLCSVITLLLSQPLLPRPLQDALIILSP